MPENSQRTTTGTTTGPTVEITSAAELAAARRRIAQLQQALDGRVVLEQAKGMLAQAWCVAPDDAFETMRGYARSNHRTLRSVAEQVVRRELTVSPLIHGRLT